NGVTLKEAVALDSPNYLVLYLDVKEAAAGSFTIDFQRGNHKLSHTYPLKQRKEGARERNGFNSSDVVYLLMPDRFVNGNPQNDLAPVKHPDKLDRSNISTRHGGDIAGVKSKADYLADLGVTAIWMTPVFENDMADMSYHGYSITDYYRVDPRLGSNQEYAELVAELQSKGIKTIKDMVFNHCGGNHPWVKDTPALDWFNSTDGYVQTNHNKNIFFDPYGAKIDHEQMTDGWFVTSMPDLNQRNPHLAKYLIQNSIWWIEYAGLNGIRQDTYPYPDTEMMAEWCRRVSEEYPNFPIVGEIMVGNPVTTAFWQANSKLNPTNTHLKCVMDFTLSSIAHAAFTEETGWDTGLQKIHNYLSYDFCYPDINNVMRLLENHDMCRFYKEQPADTK
ncbi:MAG: alpha-amylase family glycosyl hydrolase, partial [Phocaeicola sp.]